MGAAWPMRRPWRTRVRLSFQEPLKAAALLLPLSLSARRSRPEPPSVKDTSATAASKQSPLFWRVLARRAGTRLCATGVSGVLHGLEMHGLEDSSLLLDCVDSGRNQIEFAVYEDLTPETGG